MCMTKKHITMLNCFHFHWPGHVTAGMGSGRADSRSLRLNLRTSEGPLTGGGSCTDLWWIVPTVRARKESFKGLGYDKWRQRMLGHVISCVCRRGTTQASQCSSITSRFTGSTLRLTQQRSIIKQPGKGWSVSWDNHSQITAVGTALCWSGPSLSGRRQLDPINTNTRQSYIFKWVHVQLKNGHSLPAIVFYHSKVCESLVLLTAYGLWGEREGCMRWHMLFTSLYETASKI